MYNRGSRRKKRNRLKRVVILKKDILELKTGKVILASRGMLSPKQNSW